MNVNTPRVQVPVNVNIPSPALAHQASSGMGVGSRERGTEMGTWYGGRATREGPRSSDARPVKRPEPELVHTDVRSFPPRRNALDELIYIARPPKKACDLGKGNARFVLLAAFTWPTGMIGEDVEELAEVDGGDDFPD